MSAPPRAGSVVFVSVAYALCAICAVRSLALVHSIGHLVVIEAVRAAVIFGGVMLTAWIVLQARTPDGTRAPRYAPSLGRCALGGLAAGFVLGPAAMVAGALPEPTDVAGGSLETVAFLVFLGGVLGIALGLVLGLVFAGVASLAFRKAREGYADGFESSLVVSALFVGAIGTLSALAHAAVVEIDVVAIVMLVFATVGLLAHEQRGFAVAPVLGLFCAGYTYHAGNQVKPSWDSSPAPITRRAMTNLASADGVMCARRSAGGRLACWGSNAGKYLGKREGAYRTPEPEMRLGAIRAFAIADDHACAVPEVGDHRAVCWAVGAGQVDAPTGPPDVVEVAAGQGFTLALTADGAVWRWGEDPAAVSKGKAPEIVVGLTGIAHVAAGARHALALGRDGVGYCWGASPAGECGTTADRLPVTRFPEGVFDHIVGRSGMTLLHHQGNLRIEGSVPGVDRSFLFGGGHVRQVAFSQGEGCVLTDEGRVSCTRSTKAPPNGVFGSSVREIVGSSDGFCAATTSGVWCWNGYSLLFSIFG